jgi:radical SAM superfamily enzyme YgiQ (UPF0313 family)
MGKRQLKRVAFINPRGAERNNQNLILQEIYPLLQDDLALIGDDTEHVPHMGLLTIASLLPPSVEAVYLDEEYIPLDRVDQELFGSPFDLVCLSAYNPQALRAYEIARRFRSLGTPVAMGGLHVSGIPGEAAEQVDTVFVGEGEDTFRQFLKDLKEGHPRKVYEAQSPVDLASLPLPRIDLVKRLETYNKIPLFATRGCPRTCDFCIFPRVYHSSFRHKTVDQVTREVEMALRLHPDPFISFSDENMLADRAFGKAVALAMKDLGVSWECYCDVGIADDGELLSLLAQSGCRLVQIGLETVDPENLKGVDPWKCGKVKSYPQAIKKIQDAGVSVMAMFIAGFDGDGPDVFSRLKKFVMHNRVREMDFAILTPMPGTALFERLKGEGRITSENWNRYTWTRANFAPLKMTAEELQEGPLRLFRDFTARCRPF